MPSLEKQITDAALAYQWAIRGEHHKDRDCHWAIVKEWSYGEAPTYHVDHEGYLHDWDGPPSFADSHSAHVALLQFLRKSLDDMVNGDRDVDPA